MLAKVFVNALINAKSNKSAIDACNRSMLSWSKDGKKRKRGKSLEESRRLYEAYRQTGIKFKDMLPTVLKYHKPIAECFNKDMGIRLMRTDSILASSILYHFASDQCLPCLGCHDSFIVPFHAKSDLFRAMNMAYRDVLGFLPIIK